MGIYGSCDLAYLNARIMIFNGQLKLQFYLWRNSYIAQILGIYFSLK